MNLGNIRSSYISDGYGILDASSKTAQEVILSKIAKKHAVKYTVKQI